MRRITALILGLGLALCFGRAVPAQEHGFQGWESLQDEGYQFDPDDTDVAPFAITVSGEVRFAFHRAGEAMKAGRWDDAVEPLQEVVNMFPNHFFQVAEHPARWVGAGEYARFLLASFPPEARASYGEWASLRTKPRLEQALTTGDPRILWDLAIHWPLTPEGKRALQVLGDLALERGDVALASRCYRRRLAFEDPPTDDTLGAALRAAVASAFDRDLPLARRLAGGYLNEEASIGGVPQPVEVALRELAAAAPIPEYDWPVMGGSADHVRRTDFDPERLSIDGKPWEVDAFSRPPAGNPYLTRNTPEFPFIPTAYGDSLVLCDGLQVRAFSFLSKAPRWSYAGPLYDPPDRTAVCTFEQYAQPQNYRPLGSLGRSLPIAAAIARGRVVAPLIDASPRGRTIRFDRTDITTPIPRRGLHCLDLRTGEPLWTVRRPELDDLAFVNGVSLSSAIVVGDRVIATGYLSDGAINVFVVCLSLDTGDLIWKTPIMVGQQELTMFNKSFKEFTLQVPAEKDGAIYLSTNLGLLASVDTLSGDIRWATRYDTIKIQGSQHYRRPNERDTSWMNDPPLVSDGVCVFTPLDSEYFYGVDAATGRILWRRNYEDNHGMFNHLVGVQDGVLVVSGITALGFFDVTSGHPLQTYAHPRGGRAINYPMGRGVLGDHVVYLPMRDSLMVARWNKTRTAEVAVDPQYLNWDHGEGGNLLLYRDFQVVVSAGTAKVFADLDGLVRRARARVEAGDPTPRDLVELADLESQRGNYEAAIDSYTRAGAAATGDATLRRVQDGLFRAHRELAKQAEGRDYDAYIHHLTQQAEHAIDDHVFLRTAEELLRLHRGRDRARFLATLDWIDGRCPDAEYQFADHQYGGLVRVRLFTLDQRAKAAADAGEVEAAVASWQEILSRYRDLPFEGGRAGEYAAAKIDALIATHDRSVYARFDREAEDQHAAAMRSGDAGALERVIQTYPNAERSVRYRLDLARLLLDRGDQAALFAALAPLISREVPAAQKAHSLYLVARAAESAGDAALAAAIWTRLRSVGEDVGVLGGEGMSYGSIAVGEIERLSDMVSQAAERPALARLPALKPRELELTPSSYVHLVPVEHGDFAGPDQVLLYEASGALGEEDAVLRLIDVRDMRERWRARVDQFYNDEDPIVAHLFGGRLVVRQRMSLRAYDPRDGTLLYERSLPVVPEVVRPGTGLLHLAWREFDGGVTVCGLELATGSMFWQRALQTDLIDLQVSGARVLIVGREGRVHALDGLTGEDLFEISLLELTRQLEMRVFEPFKLLVVAGNGDVNGSRYRKILVGCDLDDGRRLFDVPDLFGAMSVDWLLPWQDGLLLPEASGRGNRGIHQLRVIEPRSGRVGDLSLEDMASLKLRQFDRGPSVFGRYAVFVDGGERNRRRYHPNDRLAVYDLAERRRVHLVDLERLDQDSTQYRTFATADGGVVGVVDAWPSYPRQCETYVYTLDPKSGRVELAAVPTTGRSPSAAAVAGSSLVVLKEDRLYAYPSGDQR